ncbi:alpha/beta fold hydrolase [Streptomyces sp. NPDC057052]|uniref:alpha/beta fold hydrolase n=1 Tax=Streptomyces sp. NPDC057052 TaxID=3346010 RepID=UPI00363AE83A
MFDDFELTRCEGEGARLRVRHGGSGPAVLLLHGHPRTHATWHRVAPLLAAAGHTAVCPDLRGYGESDKPPTDARHGPYSKRAMAGDVLAVMRGLGHERFAVVGHDRGAYVATRLALDHPQAVSRVSVLDAVPIGEALRRCDAGFAASWWHWFFLGQTDKPAERVINADPDAWYRATPEHLDTALSAVLDGGTISRLGVPQYEQGPIGPAGFMRNITLTGGAGPARAYIELLLPDVLDGRIAPGRVFDETFTLDRGPDAYRAMADRQVLKALLRP